MKCIQDCQTFLWGGTGTPRIDDAGGCFCICEDEWSTFNIFGVPSCVPSRAHFVFGVAGLFVSALCLHHSAHQLNRQVKYHAHFLAASTSPAEACRKQLHVVVIIHAVLSLCFFSAVLALMDRQLWLAVIFMSGLTQFTANIGGMLTLQMWIYTNDSRLMQETPEIMAILNVLERPVGQKSTSCAVCIGAFAGTVLSAARHPQMATKVACVAFVCMCVVVELAVCRCGTSLLHTINKSLLQNSLSNTTSLRTAPGTKGKGGRRDGLLVARKNIRIAMTFCLVLGVGTVAVLVYSLSSPLGLFAPLLFFAIPMGFAPLIWFGLNIQLHAGRSNRRASHGALTSAIKSGPLSGWSKRPEKGYESNCARSTKIFPTQALAASP